MTWSQAPAELIRAGRAPHGYYSNTRLTPSDTHHELHAEAPPARTPSIAQPTPALEYRILPSSSTRRYDSTPHWGHGGHSAAGVTANSSNADFDWHLRS